MSLMLKTLYGKLVLSLLALLTLISIAFIGFTVLKAPLFLQELNQKLNIDLAQNIVKEKQLLSEQGVNEQALQSVFMGLMLVNPAIEVYLIDREGTILAFSAPPGVVKREHIAMSPIDALMQGRGNLPVFGDDPRDLNRQKVFSVAPIMAKQQLQGYLYVVLGGEAYDSVLDVMKTSYMLRLWAVTVIAALILTLFAGVLIFNVITRRLRLLNRLMDGFKRSDFQQGIPMPERFDGRPGDEIDQLGTTFREMSERIIHQVKQLQHIDAARRELIANVSHDLRTPLASLQGYLETLKLKSDELNDDERRQYLSIALKHGQRLEKLISELFELATLENRDALLHFEPFSMTELVQDVAQKFRLEAEQKQLQLLIDLPAQPAFVSADISLIERVLENLIENAIKYTPESGQVRLALSVTDEQVTTLVEDTGQGISKEDLPRVFDRFFRVAKHRQNAPEGTGLGLAIAKRILQLHHSGIDVVSELNQGTRFSFPLPASAP